MFRSKPIAVTVFAAWTLLVWGQRIVNILTKNGGDGLDLARAIAFVAVGVALAYVVFRPVGPIATRRVVLGGAAVTTLLWLIQMVAIPLRDHPAGFIAVHLVLGAISIGLAAWAARSVETVDAVAAG
ncbi:MAG: hypothetical protein U0Q22_10975 [Acidimicrobiales bacterium]